MDSCITQLKAQGPSRTCNESKEEEEDTVVRRVAVPELPFSVAPPALDGRVVLRRVASHAHAHIQISRPQTARYRPHVHLVTLISENEF